MNIRNIKIDRNSIIFKLFCILFTLLLSISILVAMWTIKDTNKIVRQEMYKMNSQVLNEIGNNIFILLSNAETIIDDIVVDNKLIDILSIPEEDILVDQEGLVTKNSYVQGLLIDKVFSYSKFNMKPELYVIGKNGLTYSTYSKTKYDSKEVESYQWHKDIINSDGNTVLIITTLAVDAIFVFMGQSPQTEFLHGHMDLDEQGYIPTTEKMEATLQAAVLPGVYAAGDVRQKVFRQITTAMSDGTIAALCAERFIHSSGH